MAAAHPLPRQASSAAGLPRQASSAPGESVVAAAASVLAAPGEPAALTRWLPSDAPHADLDWARSGAMALTGEPGGPPRLAPAPLARAARAARDALLALGGGAALAGLDAPALLGERAAVFGLARRGRIAPGGSCRLLRARDGWLAVNLARPDDLALLPAWLGEGDASDPWRFAEEGAAGEPVAALVERAVLLGLPAAHAGSPPHRPPPWHRIAARGPARERAPEEAPLVLDLSALWAGPLCTHLLQLAGARVVKLESAGRPDGARAGPAAFFDLLNAGKQSVALDFASVAGRDRLRRLVERADVVVESSRPRALRQFGIDAEAWLAARAGRTWLSLTGHGRSGADADRVAFGDDAAAAAGLVVATGDAAAPLFCGDAIADPIAGLHGAVAALASFRAGGGHLLDVSLRDGVAHWLTGASGVREARVEGEETGWEVAFAGRREPVRPPRARSAAGVARALGADTAAVLAELDRPC